MGEIISYLPPDEVAWQANLDGSLLLTGDDGELLRVRETAFQPALIPGVLGVLTTVVDEESEG